MAEISPVKQTPPPSKLRPVSPDEDKERRKPAPSGKKPPQRPGEDDGPPNAIDEYA